MTRTAIEETIIHPIPPLFREDARILILGSFPSVKSREAAFFYGHPQNRFWRVLAEVFEDAVPAICLPSTSPANAAWSLERLTEAWRVVAQ